MRDEEHISFARKEFPERRLRSRLFFAPVVVKNRGKRAVALRSVEKSVERELTARKFDFFRRGR
jgi:hypothetical protein